MVEVWAGFVASIGGTSFKVGLKGLSAAIISQEVQISFHFNSILQAVG
jgi:hypothetical protein